MTENGKAGENIPADGESGPAAAPESGDARGTMRFQDPETTTPREPTLAEQRARIAAERRQEAAYEAELAEAERKSQLRRRIMIGSGATVGVVALVAAFYSAAAYSQEANAETATCTTDQSGQTIVDQDQNCDERYVNSHGGHYDSHTGMFFMPFFLPGGGLGGYHQYRYSYSPAGTTIPPVGQRMSTPNFTKPDSGTTVRTKSGSTVQRGGFGISSKSGSGS